MIVNNVNAVECQQFECKKVWLSIISYEILAKKINFTTSLQYVVKTYCGTLGRLISRVNATYTSFYGQNLLCRRVSKLFSIDSKLLTMIRCTTKTILKLTTNKI